MDQHPDNIYDPPRANLETGSFGLADLPRLSAWWVLLFTIASLYIYRLFWLYGRSRILNRIYPDDPISDMITIGFPVVWIGSFAAEMSDIYFELGLRSEIWGQPMSWISTFLVVVWAFCIRNRLIRLFRDSHLNLEVGGAMTFLFSPYYLAYKINEAKDAVTRDA